MVPLSRLRKWNQFVVSNSARDEDTKRDLYRAFMRRQEILAQREAKLDLAENKWIKTRRENKLPDPSVPKNAVKNSVEKVKRPKKKIN